MRLIRKIFISFLFSYGIFSNAFTQNWLALGGANSLPSLVVNSVCTDNLGNVYAAHQKNTSTWTVSRWNGMSWYDVGNTSPYISDIIIAIHCDNNNNLYVCGQFTGVSKWNGSTWTLLGGASGTIPGASALCSDPFGNLYAASGNKVMKWNGVVWSELSGLNITGTIKTICRDAFGNIFAAGDFTMTSAFKSVAKWNGTSWVNTGFQGNSYVTSLASDPFGNVYAGGNFTNGANSSSGLRYVSKYNGTSWSSLGSSGFNQQINSIACDAAGGLYVTGRFTNGSIKHYVAKWGGASWTEFGGVNNLNANNEVNCIHVGPTGNLYAGGRFNNLSGGGARYVAWYAQTVGIEDEILYNDKIKIYPNPSNDFIVISASHDLFGKNFKILNVKGEIVHSGLVTEDNLKVEINFPAGQYFIYCRDELAGQFIVYN